ncbi:MAG TPA: hypothetical protein VFL14_12830 [Xanthomonadales bacterium]|nr:hypothetical protein [Xanthomonadales bacterium]
MKRSSKLIVALLALAIAVPAGATSVTSVKVNRLRRVASTSDVFVQVTVPPGTLDCVGTLVANETYVFDGDTTLGRALEVVLSAAYSASKTVDIVGTGTCRTYGSPFTTRYELIQSVVVR